MSLILDSLDLGALDFPGGVQQSAMGCSGLALRRHGYRGKVWELKV